MIKLGIVGYRKYTDYDKFKEKVDEYIKEIGKPIELVSGGAKGVDTMAEKYAKENNYQIKIFYPDFEKYGKVAGPKRNTEIVKYSTHIIAFPSKHSIGTFDTINKAIKLNKKLKIVNI